MGKSLSESLVQGHINKGQVVQLCTIMHTGTVTTKEELTRIGQKWRAHHCIITVYDFLNEDKPIVTTLRNPYDVAMSWVNQDRFQRSNWIQQWMIWQDLIQRYNAHIVDLRDVDMVRRHAMPDRRKARRRSQGGRNVSHLPLNMIGLANEIIEQVGQPTFDGPTPRA